MDASYLRQFLSAASRRAKRSEIRELLKLVGRPGIVSLAGGMPPPEAFPIDDLVELLPDLLACHGATALQYGPTEGDPELRESLVRWLAATEGPMASGPSPDEILVTSAGQQGLDLCARVFLSPGDTVLCELPSYLGALGAFRAMGARLVGIPLDDEGLRTDLLRERLVALRGTGVRPKFLYTVPDFQNPTGATLSLERREELLALAREFDLLVVEDSPCRPLRFSGASPPMLASLDRDGRVVCVFTSSKILSPGLRVGWIVAHPEIVSRLAVAKQTVDLCTSGLSQLVLREYLRSGRLPAHIGRLRRLYAPRREALLDALGSHVNPDWGVRWVAPPGGLFLWLAGPSGMDAERLLERSLGRGVAFVPGRAFHCDGSGANTFRLNFTFPSEERLRTAAADLAAAIGDHLREHGRRRAVTA